MKKLKLMMASMALLGATSAMAQADGEYYLYDAATQTFLSRGADWGTKAVTDKYGLLFTWNSTEGTLTFKDNGLRLYETNGSVYTDKTSNSTGWLFTAKDGGYTLRYGAEGKFLGYESGSSTISLVDSESDAIVWSLETRDEHTATLAANQKQTYQNIITAGGFTFTADQFIEQVGKTFINKDVTDKFPSAKWAGNIGTWSWEGVRTQGGQPAYGTDFAEVYQATGTFSQTFSVPTGLYKVSMNGFERNGSNAGCTELGDAGYELTTATLEANGSFAPFASWYSGQTNGSNPNSPADGLAKFNEGKYLNELYTYVGADEQLTVKVNVPSFVGNRWVLLSNFTLTQLTELTDADVSALLANVPAGDMSSVAEENLERAKTALEAEKSVANYNALAAAIAEAKASIEAYAIAAEAIKAGEDFAANNTFTTTEALGAYTTALNTLAEGYQAKTLTTAEAKNAKTTLAVNIGGWHSNSGIAGDVLAAAWDFTKDGWSGNAYVNNWSVEGETDGTNFVVPFVEAFTGSGNLSARTLTGSVSGLDANATYKLSIWSRVESADGNAPAAGKITMKVGESGTPVDIAAGEQVGTSKLYLGTFTATGATDAEGKLTVTIDVADESNVHWLSFKNVKFVVPEVATINFNDSAYAMSTNDTKDGDILKETTYNVEDAFQLTVTPSNGSNPNRMWNSGDKPQLRVYGGSLLFKANEGEAIKAITINNKKWNASNKFNGVAASKGEWTGNATNVLLQIAGNTQINSISVTVDDADAATVTYAPAVANIKEAKSLPNNTTAAIALDNAVMTIHSGTVYALKSYLQDATGAIAVSSKLSKLDAFGQNVAVTGTLNAVVTCNDRGEYTLDVASNSSDSELMADQESATVTPEAITVAKAVASPATYYAKYVNLKNVKFVTGEDEYGYSVYTIEDGEGNSLTFNDTYYQFGSPLPKFDTFTSINGFVAYDYYGEVLEFNPYGDYEATYVPATKVASIGELKDLADGTEIELTLTDAKVTTYQLSQMGMACYLEDATGGIKLAGESGWMSLDADATSLINALNITKTGMQFNGTLFCTVNNGYGETSLSLNESTKNSEVTTTENVTVTPTALTVAQALEQASRYSMCLVKFNDIKVVYNDGEPSIVDGDNTIGIYDDFGTLLDDDLEPIVLDDTKKYEMTGILLDLGSFYGTVFCPLSYVDKTATGINSASADSILNGNVWTLNGLKAGTDVKSLKKGVYVINGKKVVVK